MKGVIASSSLQFCGNPGYLRQSRQSLKLGLIISEAPPAERVASGSPLEGGPRARAQRSGARNRALESFGTFDYDYEHEHRRKRLSTSTMSGTSWVLKNIIVKSCIGNSSCLTPGTFPGNYLYYFSPDR